MKIGDLVEKFAGNLDTGALGVVLDVDPELAPTIEVLVEGRTQNWYQEYVRPIKNTRTRTEQSPKENI